MNKLTKIFTLSVTLTASVLFSSYEDEPISLRELKEIVHQKNELPKKIKTKVLFESAIPPLCFREDYQLLQDVYPMQDSIEDKMGNVTLEDGSNWKVRPSHVHRLTKWKPGHRIVITQNDAWFYTKFPFRLINYTLKEAIDVKSYYGPDTRGNRINYIDSINTKTHEIVFHNGRKGVLRASDYPIYKHWRKGDVIATGINTSWSSDYNYILINMSSKEQIENGKAVLSNLIMY